MIKHTVRVVKIWTIHWYEEAPETSAQPPPEAKAALPEPKTEETLIDEVQPTANTPPDGDSPT